MSRIFLFTTMLALLSCALYAQPDVFTTKDQLIAGDSGIQLSIRRIISTPASANTSPKPTPPVILLLHGGGTGSTASFDLPGANGSLALPGANGSFARELAARGFIVYLMNVRGWENSTAPKYDPADTSLVAGSCQEAARDIDAVIRHIRKAESPGTKIHLFGWATGGHWAAYYASHYPDAHLASLILLNTLYSVKGPWSLNSSFADPQDSTRYNTQLSLYRVSNREAIVASRRNAVPIAGKAQYFDSAALQAYALRAISFQPDQVLRVPGGYRRESFNMAQGRSYWDAAKIRVPVLIVRSQYDFWSRPADATTLYHDLVHAPKKKLVQLPQATHFVFLDKPEKGRRQLENAIEDFTSSTK